MCLLTILFIIGCGIVYFIRKSKNLPIHYESFNPKPKGIERPKGTFPTDKTKQSIGSGYF